MSDRSDSGVVGAAPRIVRLADYRPPAWLIDHADLRFELGEESTIVTSILSVRRNPNARKHEELLLNGDSLELLGVRLNGQLLSTARYSANADCLEIAELPDECQLEITTRIFPQNNSQLSGLYKSSGNFCTQCEAEGFRRITYFCDRPDVLSRYTTTLVADPKRYPVLLSNGNCVGRGNLPSGLHWAKWEDPFPKPSYLFALVAGDLSCIEDVFTTRSGSQVRLQIYVQHHNADRCEHALNSLKKAMTWDEEVYGREYDLGVYMIVAVDDFNMGAMENKGLNIFNSKFVLAKPETATDQDYQAIESVIAHEYFHNWSGNRVTCRDWFQLSLKEGFTVFRDQEFSADVHSRGVKRISDVNVLRTQQFREDAGPMSHPVRPASYIEINNFYTVTVYNKGAEVVRMLRNLVGREKFRAGTDLYFSRHDGQAVTTDDFVQAIEDASRYDLGQFKRWYDQAGTPSLEISGRYDGQARTYEVVVKQSCPPTAGQPEKLPFHLPLAISLFDPNGLLLPLNLAGERETGCYELVLSVRGPEARFLFENVPVKPVPSYLRGFSAPVRLTTDHSDDELYFLMRHDTDEFSRWDAGQRIAANVIFRAMDQLRLGSLPHYDEEFAAAFRATLTNTKLDPAFVALSLRLPDELYLAEFMDVVDPQLIHSSSRGLRRYLANSLESDFQQVFESNSTPGPYSADAASVGRRSLRNAALGYLMELNRPEQRGLCMTQFATSNNMSDCIAALTYLVNTECEERHTALEIFFARWKHDPLVTDKWFHLQATSRLPDALEVVMRLAEHPSFTLKNPNRVRSLVGAFAHSNPVHFHRPDGLGYAFVADIILRLDPINPQVASRIAGAFSLWRRMDPQRQSAAQQQLERILAKPKLSRDVFEITSTVLGNK